MDAEEAALLAAIIANPECDTARLVYADWLEENNRKARAEFIRLQIMISRKPHATGRRRMASLLRDNRFDIVGRDLGFVSMFESTKGRMTGSFICGIGPNDGCGIELSRGFISSVRLPAKTWINWSDCVCARHPITKVTLTSVFRGADLDEKGWHTLLSSVSDKREWHHLRWPGITFEFPYPPNS